MHKNGAHAPIGLKCAPLDLARRYASFGTLEGKIGHTVMEILSYLALVNDGWMTDRRRTLKDVEPSWTSYQTANY